MGRLGLQSGACGKREKVRISGKGLESQSMPRIACWTLCFQLRVCGCIPQSTSRLHRGQRLEAYWTTVPRCPVSGKLDMRPQRSTLRQTESFAVTQGLCRNLLCSGNLLRKDLVL